MRHAKRQSGPMRTIVIVLMTVVIVNVAMIGYGVFWTWLKSTGFAEQNTVGIKPQEPPGAGLQIAAAVPVTGPGLKLTTKNNSRKLVNPIEPTGESLLRGGRAYKAVCTICHGLDGDGHGIMGAAPRLSEAPEEEVVELQRYFREFLGYTPDIDASFVLRMTDGEIYWTITNGGEAIMPGYADALAPQTRWDLVNYIKYGLGDQRGL